EPMKDIAVQGIAVEGIVVEVGGGVATVTIDRPPVNAVTMAHYAHIGEVFADLGSSLDVNCAILTGAGSRAFCAGLDLKEFLAATVEDDPRRAKIVRTSFDRVRNCWITVIAAVNGPALGVGTVFASVCYIRIAADSAR